MKGDALLFFSLKPDGGIDEMAFHMGCPVLKGIKWTATIWMRGKPFRGLSIHSSRGSG